MPGVHELEYEDGRKEEFDGSRGHYYVLDETTFLSFITTPAYCRVCQSMKRVEHVPSLSEIEQELVFAKRLRSSSAATLIKLPNPPVVRSLEERNNLEIAWRKRRTLPASCLTCGQRDIFFFPAGEWVSHPKTGERVRLRCTGMCSTSFIGDFYDVDGHRLNLSEEKRTEYWQIARQDP